VLKRTATEAQKTNPGIIQRVPLEYATLVDTLPQKSSTGRKITDYVGAFDGRKPRTASVVNGACTDRLFLRVHDNVPPCEILQGWDPSDTVEPRNSLNTLGHLPCFLTQKLGTATAAVRQVSYFRGLSPQDIYATYSKTAIQNSNDNFVINVTQSFPSIMRSTDKLGVLLMQAKAVNVVQGPLLYDSALGEDKTWHYLTNYARTRSCQQVLSMLANATDKEQQYSQLARLLQRDGPCAPSFEGFDVLQNPSDVEFSGTDYSSERGDSQCVLTVARAQDTGRDALMAVTRKYVGVTLPETLMVPVNENTFVPRNFQSHQYTYSAHYVTPALVRDAFTGYISPATRSDELPILQKKGQKMADFTAGFCNTRNLLHAPRHYDLGDTRFAFWTPQHTPQSFSANAKKLVYDSLGNTSSTDVMDGAGKYGTLVIRDRMCVASLICLRHTHKTADGLACE